MSALRFLRTAAALTVRARGASDTAKRGWVSCNRAEIPRVAELLLNSAAFRIVETSDSLHQTAKDSSGPFAVGHSRATFSGSRPV